MNFFSPAFDRSRTGDSRKEDIKEIVYSKDSVDEIVCDSRYRGVRYIIRNIGIHPCAYVECGQEFLDRHMVEYDCMEGVHVHGGVTYLGSFEQFKGPMNMLPGIFFGWDYGHCDDWAGYHSDDENLRAGNKKWETWMIIDECRDAIDQYLTQVEKDSQFDTELEVLEEMKKYCEEIKSNLVLDDAMMFVQKNDIKKYRDLLYHQVCWEGYQEEYEERLEKKLKTLERNSE